MKLSHLVLMFSLCASVANADSTCKPGLQLDATGTMCTLPLDVPVESKIMTGKEKRTHCDNEANKHDIKATLWLNSKGDACSTCLEGYGYKKDTDTCEKKPS